MEYADLKSKVEAAYADRSLLSDAATKQAVLDVVAMLDQGKLRVATQDEPGKWTTHAWIKQAVLLYFAVMPMEKSSVGPFEFYDYFGVSLEGVNAPPPAYFKLPQICKNL
jgi:2,3,4,5-tetrahydropyridine-2-carboxylate N-succinyltransferase